MDYKKFKQQYEILQISGLKQQDSNTIAQCRLSFKVYDYYEIIQRGSDIDRKINFLKNIHTLEHKNLSKLINYSYLFVQEQHGDPYCKFFLVFEYCDQSLVKLLKSLKEKEQFLSKAQIVNMTYQLVSALGFLQERDLNTQINVNNIFITDQQEYKVLIIDNQESQQVKINKHLQSLKKQIVTQIKKEQELRMGMRPQKPKVKSPKKKKEIRRFLSPEEFSNMHSILQAKYKIDIKKSEMFNLGMIIIQAGIQEDMSSLYKNFKFNEKLLDENLDKFQDLYGENYSKAIKLMVSEQSQRMTANDCLVILDQQMLKIQKDEQINMIPVELRDIIPQEYQNQLENRIVVQIKKIEEICPIQMFHNGDRFRGQKDENDLIQGWGQYWFSRGLKYEGQFVDGKYDGEGVFFWPTGVKHYGQFLNGEINGIGVRYLPNNDIYFGEWKNGKHNGYGTYFWDKGARFSGLFQNDGIMGKGTLVIPEKDGKSVRHFDGLWTDNGKLGLTTQPSQTADPIIDF